MQPGAEPFNGSRRGNRALRPYGPPTATDQDHPVQTDPINDQDLLDLAFAAGRGDLDAATRLIRRSEADVRGFIGTLADAADVDDLVQETFLRVFRALPGFRGQSTVRTWLCAIARRTAADHLRRRRCRPLTATVSDWVSVAEAAGAREQASFDDGVALSDLLDRLEPERRDAFITTKVLDLPYDEAAAICGCPVGTIRSRVSRARRDLIAAMA
jgi:RNA polymerase sigma-70 factor, ECF subfamily